MIRISIHLIYIINNISIICWLHSILFRFSAAEHSVTTEESEGHSNLAVNDIAGHNSKTK